MSVARLLPQAMTVVRHCLLVKPGDQVVLLWDETVSGELVEACRMAVIACEASPHLLTYQPLSYWDPKELSHFASASLEAPRLRLPPVLKGAMAGADCVLMLICDLKLTFIPELREIRQSGKRIISLNYFTTESALRILPSSLGEVRQVSDAVKRAGKVFQEARTARITSRAGTDLTLKLGQYATVLHVGTADAVHRQGLPAGQVAQTPDDGSANGVFVIDRSAAANDYKDLTEPIHFTVENGNVTRIDGGMEAEKLRRFLEDLGDPNVYHVTELSIGVNRRCRFTGAAMPAEDTHTAGSVGLALGCDTHQGGSTPAPVHIDMTMRYGTLELDGQRIVEDGKLLLEH